MKSFGVAAVALTGALFASRAAAELQPIITKVCLPLLLDIHSDQGHFIGFESKRCLESCPSKLIFCPCHIYIYIYIISPERLLTRERFRVRISSTRTARNSLSRVSHTSKTSARMAPAQLLEVSPNHTSILWPTRMAASVMFLFSRSWA